jgi:hypothetical protein
MLHIVPTNETFEKLAVEVIVRTWPNGLKESSRKLNNQMTSYKLSGTPWVPKHSPFSGVQMQGAPLVLGLLTGFLQLGYKLQPTIDVSMVDNQMNAIVLRRAPPADFSACPLFALWLTLADTIAAYAAPQDLLDGGIEDIVRKHWSRGLQEKKAGPDGSTEFKLRGKFLCCRGDEELEARFFILNLLKEMAARHYECIGSLDICCSDSGSGFMLFQRLNPTQ